MSVNVSTTARDLHFKFDNSCNCCCFGWKKTKMEARSPVYVKSSGLVVKFDSRGSLSEEHSIQRSMVNVRNLISLIALQKQKQEEEVISTIEARLGHPLQITRGDHLTLASMEVIDEILKGL